MTSDFSDGAPDGLVGQQVGRFLVQARLGSGGVATVYRAFDQVDEVVVALKVLPPGADAIALTRLRQEAITAGTLRHPNIVRTLQVGTPSQGDLAYIAMELVEGPSLADFLTARGRLRVDECTRLLQPIAMALDFAHDAGIIHRDVKPSNILLKTVPFGTPGAVRLEGIDDAVVPMLADFGVAKALDSPELTGVGHTVGTPAFMAPEQCAGRAEIDGRADIYALGAVLYRALIGQLPFAGTTPQILHAHLYEPLHIPPAMVGQLPPLVAELLRRSMAKAPDQRYATAALMASDLSLFSGDPILPMASASTTVEPASSFGQPATDPATGTRTMTPIRRSTTQNARSAASAGSYFLQVADAASPAPSQGQTTSRDGIDNHQRTRGRLSWWGALAAVGALLLGIGLAVAVVRVGWLTLESAQPPTPIVAVAPPHAASPTAALAGLTIVTPTATLTAEGSTPTVSLSEDAASVVEVTTTQLAATATRPFQPETLTPEPSWTPTPLATPTATLAPQLFNCPAVVDPFFRTYLSGLSSNIAERFICPTANAVEAGAAMQRFEHGFMLQLDNEPTILIYYDLNQEWERAVSTWQAGDPPPAADISPPAPDLYQPQRAFGQLWATPQRMAALGFATTAEPNRFAAVRQSFDGGALIGNRETGAVNLLLREKLRL